MGGVGKHTVFPPQEAERLAELYRYEVLDTAPEQPLDDLVHLAAYLCQAPIAVISLVDLDRQWFKSKIGLTETQTSRLIAFCAHTILRDELFVVSDALADRRFADNPLVTGDPHIRFYCGAPLTTPDGYRIGTLGIFDRIPRELSQEQLEAIRVLSHQVMGRLNLDRRHKELLTAVGERLKAEQALLASQTKFQQLTDCTSSGIYIYSGERFLYANPAAEAITGFSLEELQALSLGDLAHPDFHEVFKDHARAVEAGDQAPTRLEFPIIAKDGQIRWLDFTVGSIEFEGQRARIGTAIDITDRKQTERSLRLSEERFTLAVTGTDVGIWHWDLATNTVYYSPRWKNMLGYGEQDLPDVLATWESLIHPDDQERAMATLKAYFEGKTTRYELEHRLRHKNGSYRWILSHGAVLRDADGRPRRMAGSHLDVTERKLVERLKSIERQGLERVSRNEPLSEIMEFLVRSIESLLDGGVCSVLLVGPDGRTLQRGAVPTLPEAFSRAMDSAFIGPQNESCGTAVYRNVPVVVTDIETDPLWAPWTEAKDLALQHGLRACTSVPIVGMAGEMLGTCAVYYQVTRGPTDFEMDLLRASTHLLSIAIERARDEEALRTAEQRMQAILDHSPLLVYVKDREGHYMLTNRAFDRWFGFPTGHAVGKTDADLFPADQAAVFRACDQQVLDKGVPLSFEETVPTVGDRRAGLVVKFPLRGRDNEVYALGGIVMDISERKEVEVALADRVRQQAAVAGLGQRALAGTELQQLFQQAVEVVAATFKVEYCKVLNLLPNGSRLKLVAGVGWKEGLVGHATVSGGRDSQAGFTLLRREPVIVEDIQTERRFSGPPLLREHGVVSGISVIIGTMSQPFGVLGAHSTHRRIFSQDDVHFFQAVANVLAEAIQRKRTEEELQRSYHRLQTLSREVQRVEETERRRLSRELHDEFGQLLSALRLSLGRVQEELSKRVRKKGSMLGRNVMAAAKAADRLLVSLRELVHGLRPAVLDEFGLVIALQAMAEDIRQGTGIDCRLSIEPKNAHSMIGQELEGPLFRIAQELVTNVVRHAKATRADIRLRYADGMIALAVQDNGRGGRFAEPRKGYGLRGIHERTELLGGQVEIQSERRKGTIVTATFPVGHLSRDHGQIGSGRSTTIAKARKLPRGENV